MSKTNYFENQVVLWSLGKPNDFTNDPIDPYLCLFTGAPTESLFGTEVSTSGTAYERMSLAPYFITTFNEPGELKNIAPITWEEATADWGTVVAGGIVNGAAGSTLYRFGLVSPGLTVPTGKTLTIAAGQLLIREG